MADALVDGAISDFEAWVQALDWGRDTIGNQVHRRPAVASVWREFMETLEHVWETSRYNLWAWVYYGVTWAGVAGLIASSRITDDYRRWFRRLLVIGTTTFFALFASEARIQEKWRIRIDWAMTHQDLMTKDDWRAVNGDGANMMAGPLFEASLSFLLLVTVCIVWPMGSWVIAKIRKSPAPKSGVLPQRR